MEVYKANRGNGVQRKEVFWEQEIAWQKAMSQSERCTQETELSYLQRFERRMVDDWQKEVRR